MTESSLVDGRNPAERKNPHHGQAKAESKPKLCIHCGRRNHTAAMCKFRDVECHACGKKGHIAPICKSKGKKSPPGQRQISCRAHWVDAESELHSTRPKSADSDSDLPIYMLSNDSQPFHAEVSINGQLIRMEIDTGAAVSLMSRTQQQELFPALSLQSSDVVLITYSGECMEVCGEVTVDVRYGEQLKSLVLVIVAGSGPPLLGRNWLYHIQLHWKMIGPAAVHHTSAEMLEAILAKYPKEDLRCVRPFRVKFLVKQGSNPRFYRPQPVSYSIRDGVGEELDSQEAEGILEKVTHSDWATPIVVVH